MRPYCKRPDACVAAKRGPCRRCNGRGEERRNAVVAYHNAGERTLKEVGEYFGFSAERVRLILNQAGVTARKQPHRSLKDLAPHQLRRYRTLCEKGVPSSFAHEEVRRVAP